MKKIFIYYSFTGNGDLVADEMRVKGYDIRKVVEKKKMPKSFFLSVMEGGFRAGIHAKGKLVDYDNDVSEYDEVVIGGPIWNARLCPAINTVLAKTDLKGKKLTFVLYSGSGTGNKALKKLNKLFEDKDIIFLQEPKKYREQLDKLSIL